MLSLDDGVSDAFLRPEQQRFMTTKILEKMKELTNTERKSTNVLNFVCSLDKRLKVR